MAVTVTCSTVTKETARVLIRFSDGTEMEFASKQQVLDYIATLDSDPELAGKFLLARWAKNNPNLLNPQNLAGHSCTVDLAASPVISFV